MMPTMSGSGLTLAGWLVGWLVGWLHDCCWETFYFFACCCLVVEISLFSKQSVQQLLDSTIGALLNWCLKTGLLEAEWS